MNVAQFAILGKRQAEMARGRGWKRHDDRGERNRPHIDVEVMPVDFEGLDGAVLLPVVGDLQLRSYIDLLDRSVPSDSAR